MRIPRTGHGGARRDRTDDLLNANQVLSQLSYGPGKWYPPRQVNKLYKEQSRRRGVVVLENY